MKYFSLFEGATLSKNRLDRAVVDYLQFEISNLLIDVDGVEKFEQDLKDAIGELCKTFPKCTPVKLVRFRTDGGVRRYSLSHGPNITFALFPVRGDYSADIEEDSK